MVECSLVAPTFLSLGLFGMGTEKLREEIKPKEDSGRDYTIE